MVSPSTTFRPSRFTQLVNHLHGFGQQRREAMAQLYGAPTADAMTLAQYWVSHPEQVVEVVRRELDTSVGWRIVEEAVLEHDLGTYLDWAPARQRQQVARLGLLDPTMDQTGHCRAVMPAALAAIFAQRVRGQRGSLPVLLGRCPAQQVLRLVRQWGLSEEGSKVELILRLCDHFDSAQTTEEVLDALPSPDWIGDALMVLELGGICHWNQVYSYDLDEQLGRGENIVPLMRSHERRQQRKIAETLMEMGLLFRFEDEQSGHSMVAVPEEFWPGLWELGRRWLMDWIDQGQVSLREASASKEQTGQSVGLQRILKWWLCEIGEARLECDPDSATLSAQTVRRLDRVSDVENAVDWDVMWQLGQELRIVEPEAYGVIGTGPESKALLEQERSDFVGEALLEWCLSYTGEKVDRNLARAMGLDEAWRSRAVGLIRRQGEPVPLWMFEDGVAPTTTGGGWLRESGTGPDEIVLFEVGLVTTFAVMSKLVWLDVLSLLEPKHSYPVEGLVQLMQSIAGFSMFTQLRLVLEEQPAPVYLPFQRASILMDDRNRTAFRKWIDDIFERLLVPLGVAGLDDDEERVWLDTAMLRLPDPPGWPEGQREKLLAEIFDEKIDFELDGQPDSGLHEVMDDLGGAKLCVDEALADLLETAKGREITRFDGRFIEFSST